MKCVITGHTSGLGKALYDHFENKGWEVIGYSRSNGYPLPESLDTIVNNTHDVDLFINNSYALGNQALLTKLIARRAKKIVVCNTISKDYPFDEILANDYVAKKKELAETCNLINVSTDNTLAEVLMLTLAFMEGHTGDINNPKEITSDHVIMFNDVISAIDYWLEHPVVTEIAFKWKLTPRLAGHMLRATLPETSLVKEFKNKVNAI